MKILHHVNMRNTILTWVCITILIITTLIGKQNNGREQFMVDAEVVYQTKEHLQDHVLTSPFFRNLTTIDLQVRGFQTGQHADYAHHYINAFKKVTETDKSIIAKAMKIVHDQLKDYPNMLYTRWSFVKLSNGIENSFPHTIGDMIILNNLFLKKDIQYIAKTLIHERFHVMQRTHPILFRELYTKMNFAQHSVIRPNLLRSNPDLDGNLYIHEKSQRIPIQLYTSQYVSSLSQSSTQVLDMDGSVMSDEPNNEMFGLPSSFYCQLEHPAEITACLLTEIITNPSFVEREQKNEAVKVARMWLFQHFS